MPFRILYYEKLDSTNNLALQFAKEKAEEGTVIVSEYQTKGRGRFDRRWVSSKGKGLLFSIILRPSLKASSVPIVTHLAAQAIAGVLIHSFKLPAKLKKPNDVLIKGHKIAGILTEASGTKQDIDYVVVGIGLNVNAKKKDLPPGSTSVYLETGKKHDKGHILNDILAQFWSKYQEVNITKKTSKTSQLTYA